MMLDGFEGQMPSLSRGHIYLRSVVNNQYRCEWSRVFVLRRYHGRVYSEYANDLRLSLVKTGMNCAKCCPPDSKHYPLTLPEWLVCATTIHKTASMQGRANAL